MKPIFVTQRLSIDEKTGEVREALDIRWGDFLKRVGLLAIPLPMNGEAKNYFEIFQPAGVLFTGGNDLSCFSSDPLSLQRDRFEESLLNWAVEKGLPVLGVCRGLQMIARYFGASLGGVEKHAGLRHGLERQKGLFRFFNDFQIAATVNSSHHYGVLNEGKNLAVAARAPDGTIEAVEHKKLPIAAMMWHPEREKPFLASELKFFGDFFGGNI